MSQEKFEKQIKRIERRLEHANKRVADIKALHKGIKDGGGALTEHGGYELGYWESKVTTLEDILDELKEFHQPKTTNVGVLLDNLRRG